MLKNPQLSVIVATSRPRWLAMCLEQIRNQSVGDLRYEIIVVCEGHEVQFRRVVDKFRPNRVIQIDKERGNSGAAGKDDGIRESSGNYLCFWDDDNIYYPHALATMYAATVGFDLSLCRVGLMVSEFESIPKGKDIEFGNLDSMCICVSRRLAIKERWSDHLGAGTDFHWVNRLMKHEPAVRFVDLKIGEHLH